MENKVLPHSIAAEEYLLGQVLLEPSCIPRILEYIKSPEAFYNGHNQTIWSTIVELYSNGKDVNFATVADSLPESQKKYIKTYFSNIRCRPCNATKA